MEVLKLAQQKTEVVDFDVYCRKYDNTTTWLAETLDGHMRTSFEYNFDGNELYSQDGQCLREVFIEGLSEARELPRNLSFEYRRRLKEYQEYLSMVDMMNADDFNTMVVVSDFPNELLDSKTDAGGYDVSRRQTMLRVLKKTDQGTLSITTQTLDGSDRTGLEALYHRLGFLPELGELLGQRMLLDLNKSEQDILVDDLTDTYDQILSEKYGGYWSAGRRSLGERVNTYDFVRLQYDLVSIYLESSRYFGDNLDLLLGITATMRERYEELNKPQNNYCGFQQDTPIINSNILHEIHEAKRRAIAKGTVFSGCGLSLAGSDDKSALDQLQELGYGNKPEAKKYKFDKRMYCVVCQAPPQKGEDKKMCGPCGICCSCDKKLAKLSIAA